MAYFNDTDNASFHPISDVPRGFSLYPFLVQISATEEVGMVNDHTFPDFWSMVGQPEPVVCSPTDLWATASNCGECRFKLFVDQYLTREHPDPVTSATPYATWDNSFSQPQYPGYYWPPAGQRAQYHHPNLSTRDCSLASANFYQLGAVQTDCWEINPNGPPASYAVGSGAQLSSHIPVDAFIQEDVHALHQPSTGPTRAGPMPMGRFQPYGTSSAYLNEPGNMEAGSSTLAPLAVPLIPQPSGGRSETTADAEFQTFTEEHRATVSDFYCSRIPRVTEWSLDVRSPSGPGSPMAKGKYALAVCGRGGTVTGCATGCSGERNSRKLRASTWLWLVSTYPTPNDAPELIDCNAVAAEIIPTIRPQVYLEHRLKKGRGVRTAKGTKSADDEFERRNMERSLYQELSRYYPLGCKRELWARPSLLLKGKHRHDHSIYR